MRTGVFVIGRWATYKRNLEFIYPAVQRYNGRKKNILEKRYNLSYLFDYYGQDSDALKDILQLYLEETPKQLDHIESMLKQCNAAAIKEILHKMRVNLMVLGIAPYGGFAECIQQLSEDQAVPQEAELLFRLFRSDVESALHQIKEDYFPV